ncbi:MAG: hypothetical protein HC921_21690 [Synechococcaceae cyanobacterium SM2_3_1]|nr:hypothetical protein [Synechococcaceae cyanobacterium SM2_3_1]
MHNQKINPEDSKKLLEVEFFVIPCFDSEKDMHLDKRRGDPIPLDQITNRLQINTRYGDLLEEFGGKSILDSNDVEGSLKLSINQKCVLDIDQTTYNLVYLIALPTQYITDINLELIRTRRKEKEKEGLLLQGSDPLSDFQSYSFYFKEEEEELVLKGSDSLADFQSYSFNVPKTTKISCSFPIIPEIESQRRFLIALSSVSFS